VLNCKTGNHLMGRQIALYLNSDFFATLQESEPLIPRVFPEKNKHSFRAKFDNIPEDNLSSLF